MEYSIEFKLLFHSIIKKNIFVSNIFKNRISYVYIIGYWIKRWGNHFPMEKKKKKECAEE